MWFPPDSIAQILSEAKRPLERKRPFLQIVASGWLLHGSTVANE
jgi:hypothetical protein